MEGQENHFKVTIVGCGDAFASGGRFNTCFYLNFENVHFLVDCGSSSLVAMKQHGIPASKINFILLSHLHGDHFGGIPFFLLDAKNIQKRTEPLTIIGPKGTAQKTKELTSLLYPGTDFDDLGFNVDFLEYEPRQKVEIEELEIEAFPVIHSEESQPHGLRITRNDKVFAYSGDTEWTDRLMEISRNADLFICESNYYSPRGPNHLDYHTLVANRSRFAYKRILLNHLGEEMLSRISDLELECAYDGQEITF